MNHNTQKQFVDFKYFKYRNTVVGRIKLHTRKDYGQIYPKQDNDFVHDEFFFAISGYSPPTFN